MKTLNQLAMVTLMVCGLVLSPTLRANEEVESQEVGSVEAPPAEDTSTWTGSTNEETTPDSGTATDYDSADSGYEY